MKTFHLHLVSDSTGDTVSSVARAALVQFDNVEPHEHTWTLVRTMGQIEKVLDNIERNPGVVMYTIADVRLHKALKDGCDRLNVLSIPVLSRVIKDLSAYLGQKVSGETGKQYELDENYFDRVEAINFALNHDDGQATWDMEEADIIIIGPSRTSKSPTCMYLAFRGYRSANIPYVSGCPFPINPSEMKRALVIGLTISPDRLRDIRKNRLLTLHEDRDTTYVDVELIKDELTEMRKFLGKHGCPMIDVTRRSVEETAATIIKYYQEHKEKLLQKSNGGVV